MFIARFFVFFFINLAFLSAEQKLRVVVSFSILEDLVNVLTKDVSGIEVISIVPREADPHTYQPVPSDSIKISQADLILINGLAFEEWIDRLISSSISKTKIVSVTKGIQSRCEVMDPHVWHDITKFIIYVKNATRALCVLDSKNSKKYIENSENYIKKLKELHLWVKKMFKTLSDDQRFVITTHDAFWYFGNQYNIKFLSPVGISTDAEPSPQVVSNIIKEIKEKNIGAIFFENLTMHRKLLLQIAEETGRSIDDVLYADSLSYDGGASTYIGMIEHNVNTIIRASKKLQ